MPPHRRCYDCFRPHAACFCDSIPPIDNRTEVLILQHRRERFHRFNTARIVQKSLRNSILLADHIQNLRQRLHLKPGAGLLYPGPAARLISEVPAHERPQQLVILDGTWHHAKTLLRDIPALQSLPRYKIAPSSPSRYRIRREPSATALSTIEATVAALRILEPETVGFERLLSVFESLIDKQLAHPGSSSGSRFKYRRRRTVKNIPFALQHSLQHLVVAYGEAQPGERGCKSSSQPPITWVAQRLGDGAFFSCRLHPANLLSDTFLQHLELDRTAFDGALSLAEVRRQWAQFQRPNDVVAVFHAGTAQLYSHLADRPAPCLVLKSIEVESPLQLEMTESTATAENELRTSIQTAGEIMSGALTFPISLGRSTKRLAYAIALVRQLNALSVTAASSRRPSAPSA